MKKILLLAMAAVMFMGCENAGGGGSSSGGGMSSKDKTAVNATTVNAIKLIGQSSAKADKAFTDAGFVKMDEDSKIAIKARAPKQVPAVKQDGTSSIAYLYGVSQDATAEELAQALKDGKSVIMLEAMISGDIFVGASTMIIVGKTAGVNKKFTYTSNELYDALPGGDMSTWTGQTAPDAASLDAGGTTYTSHSSFSMDINKAEEIAAVEAATGITDINYQTGDYEGFGYYLAWVNPSEEDFYKSSLSYIGTPVAVGEYFVADIKAMSEMMN